MRPRQNVVTPERKKILKAFGADVVFTDPMQGSDGAISRAANSSPSGRISTFTDQHKQRVQLAHYDTTAPELIEQTGGRITIAGLGTSGIACRDRPPPA